MSEIIFNKLNSIKNVSRETFEDLKLYVDMLKKWNNSINLIGKTTENQIWDRHIIDSMQLERYIDKDVKVITDLGSGAGLPGVVLAISDRERIVHLVESDQRKCAFLREVSATLKLNIKIHNERIEGIENSWESDLVTARAFASLEKIFSIAKKILQKSKNSIFLKGENVVQEIEEAKNFWNFEYVLYDSITDNKGKIIKVAVQI